MTLPQAFYVQYMTNSSQEPIEFDSQKRQRNYRLALSATQKYMYTMLPSLDS